MEHQPARRASGYSCWKGIGVAGAVKRQRLNTGQVVIRAYQMSPCLIRTSGSKPPSHTRLLPLMESAAS